MYVIETKIKEAFEAYKKDGNLLKLVADVVYVADYSIRCQEHAMIMNDKIRQYCPTTLFECVYYDGTSGDYHLLDFDPNDISRESLLIEIRARLTHKFHIPSDYIDKAMESVYLLNTGTLVKVKED